jgi:uncharacterized protein (TIGR00297 family)
VTGHNESARQWVHAGSGAFALALRFLAWWQAALLAAFALVFNAVLLPRIGGRRLYRPVDEARGFPLGILLYPLAVLTLILMFPSRLDIVAAAWAILALGDGAATLVGRAVRSAPLPWNRDKSIAGTAAFIGLGAIGGVALAWWTRPAIDPQPSLTFTIVAPILAAVAAAFVETIPVRLDDNISVPAAAAAVLWLSSIATAGALRGAWPSIVATLPFALAVNLPVSYLGYRAKTVSVSGWLGGAVIGLVIYACLGGGAWLFLFATFLVASVTSRIGLERKLLLGIAEERGGRRGAGNAIANCGIAAAAAIAAVTSPYREAALLVFVAALTAGGSDTVASEIGKAFGKTTFLITTFRRAAAGTPGAMSLEGTAAGLLSALALGALAVLLQLIPSTAVVAVSVAATIGALAESALGATLEGPGILNNDVLNFLNTAVAAAAVLAIG